MATLFARSLFFRKLGDKTSGSLYVAARWGGTLYIGESGVDGGIATSPLQTLSLAGVFANVVGFDVAPENVTALLATNGRLWIGGTVGSVITLWRYDGVGLLAASDASLAAPINAIGTIGDRVLVMTDEGLFEKLGEKFVKIEASGAACLTPTPNGLAGIRPFVLTTDASGVDPGTGLEITGHSLGLSFIVEMPCKLKELDDGSFLSTEEHSISAQSKFESPGLNSFEYFGGRFYVGSRMGTTTSDNTAKGGINETTTVRQVLMRLDSADLRFLDGKPTNLPANFGDSAELIATIVPNVCNIARIANFNNRITLLGTLTETNEWVAIDYDELSTEGVIGCPWGTAETMQYVLRGNSPVVIVNRLVNNVNHVEFWTEQSWIPATGNDAQKNSYQKGMPNYLWSGANLRFEPKTAIAANVVAPSHLIWESKRNTWALAVNGGGTATYFEYSDPNENFTPSSTVPAGFHLKCIRKLGGRWVTVGVPPASFTNNIATKPYLRWDATTQTLEFDTVTGGDTHYLHWDGTDYVPSDVLAKPGPPYLELSGSNYLRGFGFLFPYDKAVYSELRFIPGLGFMRFKPLTGKTAIFNFSAIDRDIAKFRAKPEQTVIKDDDIPQVLYRVDATEVATDLDSYFPGELNQLVHVAKVGRQLSLLAMVPAGKTLPGLDVRFE